MFDFMENGEGEKLVKIINTIIPIVIGLIVFLLARKKKAQSLEENPEDEDLEKDFYHHEETGENQFKKKYKPIDPR